MLDNTIVVMAAIAAVVAIVGLAVFNYRLHRDLNNRPRVEVPTYCDLPHCDHNEAQMNRLNRGPNVVHVLSEIGPFNIELHAPRTGYTSGSVVVYLPHGYNSQNFIGLLGQELARVSNEEFQLDLAMDTRLGYDAVVSSPVGPIVRMETVKRIAEYLDSIIDAPTPVVRRR